MPHIDEIIRICREVIDGDAYLEESVIFDILDEAYKAKSEVGGGGRVKRSVYEIADIKKHDGLTEADSARLGRRLYPTLIEVGSPALLLHADDTTKMLRTSTVTSVEEQSEAITFTTRNTTYTIRKVT
ncbi:hypothetical protein [Brevibacillus daliensis]|uniref:hypothetical protein n=1 Tax=Brevibacillus daliensis TaxID=2892995 RepID=UPI001E2AB1F9|nr:hypothetical protein [Brevibacillus daliensis]